MYLMPGMNGAVLVAGAEALMQPLCGLCGKRCAGWSEEEVRSLAGSCACCDECYMQEVEPEGTA
jgi:hypothetical protein